MLDAAFNPYCRTTRPGTHRPRAFSKAEASIGAAILEVEHEIFAAAQ
ncbi:MAG: hypothetical protein K8H88_21035 [Sandaracinaceae bacterium]|nr:hypothetical protein [Sandaracinaceae bacterium]